MYVTHSGTDVVSNILLPVSLLAHYWSSPDPGLPCYHVVCEASVDTYSVTNMENMLRADKLI